MSPHHHVATEGIRSSSFKSCRLKPGRNAICNAVSARPEPSAFATTPKEQLIKATDNGDTVKFQRQTPFGTTNWEKKKSELTDEERHIFESQQPKPE